MSESGFPCTGCGACCMVIGKVLSNVDCLDNPVLRAAVEVFPYKADENGVCEKLIDNKCSVYDDRPIMCNVAALGQLLGRNPYEFYSENIKYCNQLIDLFGLDESYKITQEGLK